MKTFSVRYACAGFTSAILSTLFLTSSLYGQQQVLSSPEVLIPVKMGISQPVRDLPLISQQEIESWPDGIIPHLITLSIHSTKVYK